MRASRIAVLIMIALLASCSKKSGLAPSCPVRWMPPAQYQGDAPPGTVILKIDYWSVDQTCAAKTGYYGGDDPQVMSNQRAAACFRYINPPYKVPMIIVANTGGGINQLCQNLLIDHEIGHARGWKANHPGAISAEAFLKNHPNG